MECQQSATHELIKRFKGSRDKSIEPHQVLDVVLPFAKVPGEWRRTAAQASAASLCELGFQRPLAFGTSIATMGFPISLTKNNGNTNKPVCLRRKHRPMATGPSLQIDGILGIRRKRFGMYVEPGVLYTKPQASHNQNLVIKGATKNDAKI